MTSRSSNAFPHILPVEVLSEVFLVAATENSSTAAQLCLVCKLSQSWVLPELYRNITLSSSSQIRAFAHTLQSSLLSSSSSTWSYTLTEPPRTSTPTPTPALHTYVRSIWFGPTSSSNSHDLSYDLSSWPEPLVHEIIIRCQGLRALAIVSSSYAAVHGLADILPPSVAALHLGPRYAHVDLRKCPGLRCLTTMDKILAERDWQEVSAAGVLRVLRLFFSSAERDAFMYDPLPLLDLDVDERVGTEWEWESSRRDAAAAPRQTEVELICCGKTLEDALDTIARRAQRSETGRVKTVAMADGKEVGGRVVSDGVRAFYVDWRMALGYELGERGKRVVGGRVRLI